MSDQMVRILFVPNGEPRPAGDMPGADMLISANDFRDLPLESLMQRYLFPTVHMIRQQLNERRDSLPGESR